MCTITEIARDTLLSNDKHKQTIQLHASSFKYQEKAPWDGKHNHVHAHSSHDSPFVSDCVFSLP